MSAVEGYGEIADGLTATPATVPDRAVVDTVALMDAVINGAAL